jgi:hypothetical protein
MFALLKNRIIFVARYLFNQKTHNNMKKVAAGYYEGEYKGICFSIIKAELPSTCWYWKIGEDWCVHDCFPNKKTAILAVKDWIDNDMVSIN